MPLNKEQEQMVSTLDSNILLLASAGTGKTGSLAARVATILEKHLAAPEEILCLTFTNKASREMKKAIINKVGALGQRVHVGTFHQFCLTILQEESKESLRFYHEMTVFDEEECALLLQDVSKHLTTGLSIQELNAIVSLLKEKIAILAAEERDYEILRRWLLTDVAKKEILKKITYSRKAEELASRWSAEGANTLEAYDRALQEQHGLDFTDLITYVHMLFQDRNVLKRWEERFRFVMVDEVQDTSVLEYRVLKPLLPKKGTLLCGDFFQTIYSWRGSNPEMVIGDYKQHFSPIEISFYENYRTTQALFNSTFETLQAMFPKEVGTYYSNRPRAANGRKGTGPAVWVASDIEHEGEMIFEALSQHWKKGEKSLCVLVRNNIYAQEMSRVFERMNKQVGNNRLPFLLVDAFKFYRREEIKDVLAFLKLLANPYDIQSAKRIMKKFIPHVGEATLRTLDSSETRKTGLRLTDFMDFRIFQGDLYEPLWEGLEKEEIVVFDVESTGTDTTRDEIIQIAAIRLDAKGGIKETFERFITPSKPVGASELIHRFSDSWLQENGEKAEQVFADFSTFLQGSVVVGHNVGYDMSILKSELLRHGMPVVKVKAVYDTLDLYRRFYPNEKKHTLEHLSKVFQTAHTPTHNALADITATAELLIYILEKDVRPSLDARRAFTLKYKDAFGEMASRMATLRRKSEEELPSQLVVYIMNEMGVKDHFQRDPARMHRLRELYRMLVEQEREWNGSISAQDALKRSLDVATLSANDGMLRLQSESIPIITIHQAKGSEFDHVFLAGMMEGVFPSFLAIREHTMEEEKRLFYVAITRPKQSLVLTYAKERYHRKQQVSSLIQYLPASMVEGGIHT